MEYPSQPSAPKEQAINELAQRTYELINKVTIEEQYLVLNQLREVFKDREPRIKVMEMQKHGLTQSVYDYFNYEKSNLNPETVLIVVDKLEEIVGYYSSLEDS